MDTDDLSNETYHGIIIEAEKFNHDLTLQFGILSEHCKNEEEYLEKSIHLISEMKSFDGNQLDDIFFGNVPILTDFYKTLDKIIENIEKIKQISIDKRHFEF